MIRANYFRREIIHFSLNLSTHFKKEFGFFVMGRTELKSISKWGKQNLKTPIPNAYPEAAVNLECLDLDWIFPKRAAKPPNQFPSGIIRESTPAPKPEIRHSIQKKDHPIPPANHLVFCPLTHQSKTSPLIIFLVAKILLKSAIGNRNSKISSHR